ncbi:MAG: YlxR family protein [Bowdeniella nasicola]|nr:YlxR family protein [Bowdeniella nasicola]
MNVTIAWRTCVGCRRRSPRDQLARFVLRGERACYDPQRSAPGRGAWLHPECRDLALKRGGFSRAFRTSVRDADLIENRSPSGEQTTTATVAKTEESGLEADGHPMSTQR